LDILEREWDYDSEKGLYLCKLPAPGFSQEELVYITLLPLEKAIKEFEEKIRKPLNLNPFEDPKFRRKTSNNGRGVPYFQVYLYTKDKRYKTKVSIRSRTKD